MRVIDFFDRAARDYPDRKAFVAGEEVYTYTEMQDFSIRIAAGMLERGFTDTTRVAVYSPNNVRAFACILATFRAGGTWVPINARNKVQSNIDFMNLTEVEWLFFHSSFSLVMEGLYEHVPTLRHLVCIDDVSSTAITLSEFCADMNGHELPDIPHDPHQMATIIGSGGTTGKSKGVMWENLTWETLIAETGITMRCDVPPVHLCVAPMTHAAGVLAFMLTPRAPMHVVMERVDPLEIMQNIERFKVTHLFLPPTVLYAMLAHPRVREFDYSSLTHFLVAASPIAPDKLAEAVEVFGPCLCQCYGQVEAPMMLTYLTQTEIVEAVRNEEFRHRLMSCGRPGALSVIEIMDDEGNVLPRGERGEIVARGNLVAPCYYRNPEGTAEAQKFGWLHTGDVAYQDEDGYVYIVDRKKDLIISGGFNVFSAEVENIINGHPAVENCAVIGIPHEKWGEAVKAIVVLRPGKSATEQDIIQFVKDEIGSVKAPKSVDFWDELPRSPVGKVLKSEIRKQFWSDTERAVN